MLESSQQKQNSWGVKKCSRELRYPLPLLRDVCARTAVSNWWVDLNLSEMVLCTKKVQNPLSHASRVRPAGISKLCAGDTPGQGWKPWVLCLPRCSMGLVVTLTCGRADKLCVCARSGLWMKPGESLSSLFLQALSGIGSAWCQAKCNNSVAQGSCFCFLIHSLRYGFALRLGRGSFLPFANSKGERLCTVRWMTVVIFESWDIARSAQTNSKFFYLHRLKFKCSCGRDHWQ